jgi:hypothetical protein
MTADDVNALTETTRNMMLKTLKEISVPSEVAEEEHQEASNSPEIKEDSADDPVTSAQVETAVPVNGENRRRSRL